MILFKINNNKLFIPTNQEERYLGLSNPTLKFKKGDKMVFYTDAITSKRNNLPDFHIHYSTLLGGKTVRKAIKPEPNQDYNFPVPGVVVEEVLSDREAIMARNGLKLEPESVEDLVVMHTNEYKEKGPQAIVESGSRIFSIPHTAELVEKAHSAVGESALIDLGKTVFKFLDIQDETPEEYVYE